jgi:hypothetical protein
MSVKLISLIAIEVRFGNLNTKDPTSAPFNVRETGASSVFPAIVIKAGIPACS